jgi:molybdopterin-guanine dinucleotide biosynthesis protein B
LKPPVIAVVGAKKVGKTTTTEKLIAELTKRGCRVAAIKHISEPDFTMDTPGKDTWRYQQAGAKTIIAMAPNETATIEKGTTQNTPLTALLRKCEGNDVILIEGFKKIVAKKTGIPKIVVVTSQTEAEAALETYKPILAFSGPYNPNNKRIPYADATKNVEKLADIIEKTILKK